MLFLASASPRRQELLRNAGISYVVQPTDISEIPKEGESARECAERLAGEKAMAVFRLRPEDLVLGADTVVVIDGEILGKPRDVADAVRMLRLLSGRVHQVITGVCLIGPCTSEAKALAHWDALNAGPKALRHPGSTNAGGSSASQATVSGSVYFEDVRSETTLVTFATLADEDIRTYVATGEPMDKAGAYGIQGIASRWIPRIEGDYFNVVGLPVALVWSMLRKHGADSG
jgi:septum formation protein